VSSETATLPAGLGSPPTQRFALVVSLVAGTLNSYKIDVTSGALTPSAAPNTGPVGPNAFAIATHPCGCFAYVANFNSNDVSSFAVDTVTGALTSLGATTSAGTSPSGIVVEPLGRYLYVSNNVGAANFMYGYSIAADGTLTPLNGGLAYTGTGATNGTALVADPTGQYVLAADDAGGVSGIDIYAINQATGDLTNPASVTAGPPASSPIGIAMDPTHSYVYMANQTSGTLSAFSYDLPGESLLESTGSPFSTGGGGGTAAVRVDPGGGFVYAVDASGLGGTSSFQIDPGSATPGALVSLQAGLPSGTSADALAITSDGKFVYVSDNVGPGEIHLYTRDPSTGLLTSQGPTLTLGDQAYGIVTLP
jgi:6-phosphogluconolactonase (cycloisomerase 2 family)